MTTAAFVSPISTSQVEIGAQGTNADVVRLAQRPGLDGLRGLAVAAVIAYHLGVPGARGGFLGVDVFFVVSGYLITALLLTEHAASGRIHLRSFWARRARRLLPALVLVLVAVAVWGHLAAPAATLDRLRGDGLASLAYVANWRFVVTGQSYVDGFLDPSPLRHLWSLGVEEQWYLVWPLALMALLALAARLRRRATVVAVIVGGALVSAVLMAALHHPGTDPSRAYYGTDTRAEALLVGAAVAAWRVGRPLAWPRRRLADVGALVGLVALGAAVAAARPDADWLYRGGFGAVALATVLVVAVAADGRGPLAEALGARPLTWVGERSYGLYLWHWPVVVALTEATTGWSGPGLAAARLAVTVALAMASYRFVEQPVRQGRWPMLPAVGAGTVAVAASLALLVTLATPPSARPALADALRPRATSPTSPTSPTTSTPATPATAPAPTLATAPAASPATSATPATAAASATAVPPTAAPPPAAPAAVGPPAPLTVLLLGDSQAVALGSSFTAGDAGPGVDVQGYAEVGCGVVPDTYECKGWRQAWADAIERVRPGVVVLMIGAWEVLDHRIDGRWVRFGQPGWTQAVSAAISDAVATAAAGGVPVAVLDVPCFAQAPGSPFRTEQRNQTERVVAVNRLLAEAATRQPGVQVLDYGAVVCPGGDADAEVAGAPLRYDGVHLSPAGARVTWAWLGPQVGALATTSPRPSG